MCCLRAVIPNLIDLVKKNRKNIENEKKLLLEHKLFQKNQRSRKRVWDLEVQGHIVVRQFQGQVLHMYYYSYFHWIVQPKNIRNQKVWLLQLNKFQK